MYGCMALMTEKYEEAETFFEAATCAESRSVIAWTMLGKYYNTNGSVFTSYLAHNFEPVFAKCKITFKLKKASKY